MAKERVLWVDIVKIFSLIYIVTEHFIQSMQKSGFIPYNQFWLYIDTICAWIMVQLFFFCSGYLHQKQCKVNDFNSWWKQLLKKLYYLGVPYFAFSLITILMKTVASEQVNNELEQGVLYTLFVEPIPPYWFIYVLFILFAISIPIRSKKNVCSFIIIAVAMYAIYIYVPMPYLLQETFRYELWFVLGMVMGYGDWLSAVPSWVKYVLLTFIPVSVWLFMCGSITMWMILGMGIWAGLLIIMWARYIGEHISQNENIKKKIPVITKFIMPIFLMQTIFAAGYRIVLMHFGINNAFIHITGGLVITFVGPSIAAFLYWNIMKKVKYVVKGKKEV